MAFVRSTFILLVLGLMIGLCCAVTEISACQALSSANTVYRLTQSVSIQGATCFSVTAENVTLECLGYQLAGNKAADTSGIASGSRNTTVDSCIVNGFDDGIDFSSGADSSTVQHSTSKNHTLSALLASRISGLFVSNTTLSTSQDGVQLESINSTTFNWLTITGHSRYGLFSNQSKSNEVHNSTIATSATYDVFSDLASSTTFVNTTFNRSKVGWNDAAASNVTVKWFFRILTQNATGGAIPSVSVNVTNASSSTPEYQLSSDSSGLTSYNPVTEYFQNGNQVYGTNETRHTPHNVTCKVADYYFVGASVQNSTNATVSASQTFTSVLAGNWALIKGSFGGRKIINTSDEDAFFSESNSSPYGHVFVLPQDGNFNFSSLTALTRNTSAGVESDDFADADALLGTVGQLDSITQIFGGGSTTPTRMDTFTVAGYSRTGVPVVNSTNSSNFLTGLLWHSQAVTNFTQSAKPTLILVTRVNRQAQGKYGVYDYEIRVPATLDSYHGGTVVELYGEVN